MPLDLMCVNLVPTGRGVATGFPVGDAEFDGMFVTGVALGSEVIGWMVGNSVLIVTGILTLSDVCSGIVWFDGSVAIISVGIQVCVENVASVVGTVLAGNDVSVVGMELSGTCTSIVGRALAVTATPVNEMIPAEPVSCGISVFAGYPLSCGFILEGCSDKMIGEVGATYGGIVTTFPSVSVICPLQHQVPI